MTAPAFNTPFDPYYDQFSISYKDFVVPDHFDVYIPEFTNEIDFHCLSVICPSPNKGAKLWTYGGKWLTIGIYRDEGREPAIRPIRSGLSWVQNSNLLTFVDPAGHLLVTGDKVDLYNINVTSLLAVPITVLNSTTFTVPVEVGSSSGSSGAYQPTDPYNFYEQNYVFRILPSFALVRWSLIQELFAASAPTIDPQQREMYNITTNSSKILPKGISATTNYNLPTSSIPIAAKLPLDRRFGQLYNEQGYPLDINYISNGQPVPSKSYDSPHLSSHKSFNSSLTNEDVVYGDNFRVTNGNDQRITDIADLRILFLPDNGDTRVYVFDFYGGEINDPTRGPYFRDDLIVRDTTKPAPYDNILRDDQNNVPYYAGALYDIFSNKVIGIQENNATVVRENLLPLKLDRFSRPVKSPVKTTIKGQYV